MRDSLRHALDPVSWARDCLGFKCDQWQSEALRSQATRQIFLLGRQTGKSTVASLRALHTAVFQPGSLSLLLSPTQRQSSELFRTMAGFLQQLEGLPAPEEFSRLFVTMKNASRIVSLPGDPTTVRGYAAPALVVVDEAARTDEGLLSAVMPMLATNDSGILMLLSTPAGRRGRFHDIWKSKDTIWKRFSLRSDQCPRISAAFLKEQRLSMPKMMFEQEFENKFIALEGSLFDDAMIEGMKCDYDVSDYNFNRYGDAQAERSLTVKGVQAYGTT